MMPPEQRSSDRTSYYTMKTPGRSQPASSPSRASHSRSNSQTFFPVNMSNSPMGSPRMPHSVGQTYPPKLSPGVTRVTGQEARTPSPNYFGLAVEPIADPRDSGVLPRDNWSPPTSSVKSFGAAIPKQLPLDANPEFEAFRRQVDLNRGRGGFNLSTSHFGGVGAITIPTASTPSALQRPRPPRWHTHDSNASETSLSRVPGAARPGSKLADGGNPKLDADADSLHDSAYVSGDSKRNSEASLNPPSFLSIGRFESPANFEGPFTAPDQKRLNLTKIDDRHPRLSLIPDNAEPKLTGLNMKPRADTVPLKLESGGPAMMAPAELKELLEKGNADDVLLLDLRVSPQYAESRIVGALNFCVPTTLLKRPTFNLQKLQQTFQSDQDREKFAKWSKASYLVVYDAASSERRDATSGMNMLKKFTTEGYAGSINILRGGFRAFAAAHPQFIDRTSGASAPGLALGGGAVSAQSARRPSIAPVIGGVSLPNAGNSTNPFFNNIRQNQDLIDGVGQMDVKLPPTLNAEGLPRWLREAGDTSNKGKIVSDKFLQIELAEQARMKDAYSSFNPNIKGGLSEASRVQLSGIEKGGKNRYKDILPFEHARVRLQGRDAGACDYVNASHIQASRSHKRYIASQGPLPATFEDFWSMIWDQDVRVIVMLTAESEGGQLKCHPYWDGKEFGPIKLRSLSEKKVSLDMDKYRSSSSANTSQSSGPSSASSSSTSSGGTVRPDSNPWGNPSAEMGRRRANTTTTLESSAPTPNQPQSGAGETPYVIIRKFALSHTAYPFAPMREITHLHYPSWPDFGAPAQPSHLLALVELANVMQRAALPAGLPGTLSSASDSLPGSSPFANAEVDYSGSGSKARGPRSGTRKKDGVSLGWHDSPEPNENVRPMLVHCSAGCGRTGAFCTVDSVIDMLKRQRLQAVKEANRIIAAREQRIAQEMNDARARLPLSLQTDSEGDISMSDDFDSISPLATIKGPPSFPIDAVASMDASIAAAGGDVKMDEDEGSLSEEEGIDTNWLGDDAVDLIAQTVEDFRGQRLSMVQSLRQFVLCYESVIEWVWRLQERGGAIGTASGRGRHNRTSSLAV
ncbi:phosphatases II [Thozetella sp. PMI_491]|nr:phosphatases II [Thozetella sp. PMI_491]